MIGQPLSPRLLTVLTDLSLILFLVCASALQDGPAGQASAASPAARAHAAHAPSPHETPVMMSVWSDAPGGITLAQWLSEQPPDDGQRLAIEVTYREGTVEAAFARADALRRSAGTAGADARVLIVEGPADLVLAQLVQDHAPQSPAPTPNPPPPRATGPVIAKQPLVE